MVVIDRLELFRAGLGRILAGAGYVVEERTSPDESCAEAGLVVFVVREHGAWAAFEAIRDRHELVAVLSEPSWCPYALKAGATSIVLQDSSPETFLIAVAAAQAGLTVVPREAACLMQRSGPFAAGTHSLEARERRWLLALSEGSTVASLAQQCSFSEREMHRRLARIYARLGVSRRAEAIALAERWGILDEARVVRQVSDAHPSDS